MQMINKKIQEVTDNIIKRSAASRERYLKETANNFNDKRHRNKLSCGNLAHGFAGCEAHEKSAIAEGIAPNIGLVTAYNDMLSAHKPYEDYPKELRSYAYQLNSTLQVAGGVPAMCDGVTQGQPGMDLSLLSRDVIAFSTAIALSHDMFDGAANLGICDKIVPGLLIGNLSFGHLPSIFIPGGPMESGISNEEKARIRQEFAEGKISRKELLKGESDSYHSPGTCTFYGTANSNQMLMEIMGLQLPGSSFINPGTTMRAAMNKEAIRVLIDNIECKDVKRTLGYQFDEKSVVNGIIGLLATGGSTNHTLHILAVANAAGIKVTWKDFSDLSDVIPSICKVYPNGAADINHFHASGGMAFVTKTLLENGLLHNDVGTVLGRGMESYTKEPKLIEDKIVYVDGPKESLNPSIIRSCNDPFNPTGGMKVLSGNMGTSVIKTSAVAAEFHLIEEDIIVFDDQEDLIKMFKNGELNRNFIAVIPFQGPRQKGMPELHNLTPTLTILQKKGFKVALVTDGRMSGASGKVPAAIHVSPEAALGGLIGKLKTGDRVLLDAVTGRLECLTPGVASREERVVAYDDRSHGRQLFERIRQLSTPSDEGASII
jgi:phosphogluconate dehydratase